MERGLQQENTNKKSLFRYVITRILDDEWFLQERPKYILLYGGLRRSRQQIRRGLERLTSAEVFETQTFLEGETNEFYIIDLYSFATAYFSVSR